MLLLNLLFKRSFHIIWIVIFFTACGDHSKPTEVTSTSTPIINLTSGPYAVVVNKDLIVGVETKFAAKEPIYSAIPTPIGIAIVNQILPGQIFVTGVKAGSTTFTISDLANPTAVPRTLLVSVTDAPKLIVKPTKLTGAVGQTILIEVSTLNAENTAAYLFTVNDTSIARILDIVNNPNLVNLIKAGTTTVTIKDTGNDVTEDFTLIVTP